MNVRMICFSRSGHHLGTRLRSGMETAGYDVGLDSKCRDLKESIEEDLHSWTAAQFGKADVLIFIGALGIAVRSIAPFVSSKKTDPAVLCIDDAGRFVISLLSGHLGGANEFAEKTAQMIGAVPVITTSTDINGKFAIDVFARRNGCALFPMEAAKHFSADLLAGKRTGFVSEFPIDGDIPEGVDLIKENAGPDVPGAAGCGAALTIRKKEYPFEETAILVPKCVTAGIGCRRGQSYESIRSFFLNCIEEAGLYAESIRCIASIGLKKDEEGLIRLAQEMKIPFITFSSDELAGVPGDFSASGFVRSVTGVDNVCERSAVLASQKGKLIFPKYAGGGVTCAFALDDWRGSF